MALVAWCHRAANFAPGRQLRSPDEPAVIVVLLLLLFGAPAVVVNVVISQSGAGGGRKEMSITGGVHPPKGVQIPGPGLGTNRQINHSVEKFCRKLALHGMCLKDMATSFPALSYLTVRHAGYRDVTLSRSKKPSSSFSF
uniref:Uncharacterized protein n=1 Tax=Anopheles farauti TaxID=69004 RepID=A0A182QKF2_9DIPT